MFSIFVGTNDREISVAATPEKMTVYVDGFNLYHGLHERWRCRYLWLDLVALAESLRPRNDIVKVNYFTAPVLNDPAALSRQATYIKALEASYPGRLEVINGRYQSKQMHCRQCGHTYIKYEEKETDVSIAVRIVADAVSGSTDSMMIISADSDMLPAITTARNLNPKLVVVAAFPPKRRSDEIRKSLNSVFHIGASKIKGAQLPDKVQGPGGIEYARPAKWSI